MTNDEVRLLQQENAYLIELLDEIRTAAKIPQGYHIVDSIIRLRTFRDGIAHSGMSNAAVEALTSVLTERKRQDEKWGEQNHNNYKWLAILSEEVGEVAQAMLDDETSAVRDELIQVAAVALAWLECDYRGKLSGSAG